MRRSFIAWSATAIVLPLLGAAAWPHLPARGRLPAVAATGSSFPASAELRLHRSTIGPAPLGLPCITNVQVADLDGDAANEVLVCDAQRNAVLAYARTPSGGWSERVLAADVPAPAHVSVSDFDADGDQDLLVAVLGNLEPDDGLVGRVLWLERSGDGFVPHLIVDGIRRVADVQAADLDADGDQDLAVAVFGYSHGQVLWIENRGDGKFRPHELHAGPGVIHVPIADFDGDGDPDLAAIVTQDEEEVWAFENRGGGEFQPRRIKQWFNFDLGGAGLIASDLDDDGDPDLIAPVGDNLEDLDPYPQPYHGCYWFENLGDWSFEPRRIAAFGGTYAAAVADLDGDGPRDVVLVSMANDFRRPEHASVVWLRNDGRQNFAPRQLDHEPIHLVTVACGDLDGDEIPDIVGGSLNVRPPFERIGRVTAWLSGTNP